MPDVLEMPYRPPLKDAGEPEKGEAEGAPARGTADRPYVYRLAGPTCLAGDVIGDYTFRQQLQPGDRLEFQDMAGNQTDAGIRRLTFPCGCANLFIRPEQIRIVGKATTKRVTCRIFYREIPGI